MGVNPGAHSIGGDNRCMVTSILFVCMGNICRSPTVHGVLRHQLRVAGLADAVRVDSAATHNYHPGEPPDPRSQRHAARRGYDVSDLRARPVTSQDFDRFDLILAMDHDNLKHLHAQAPVHHRHKIHLLGDFFDRHDTRVVPDPYYGGAAGFEQVLDLAEDACQGLIRYLRGPVG